MSADGSIELDWAGERRKFRLRIGELRELQENINRWRSAIGSPAIGPRTLLTLLAAGDAWPDEVREIIRLGLIGGGTKIDRVPGLVKRYIDERPLLESTQIAQAVLLIALVGVPDDQVGKKSQQSESDQEENLTSLSSPLSTEPDASSDTHPSRSTECPSGSLPPASTDTTRPIAQATSQRP